MAIDTNASSTRILKRTGIDEHQPENRPARGLAGSTLILRKSIRNPKMEYIRVESLWAGTLFARDVTGDTGDNYSFCWEKK
jgi:hypothetical protein